MALVPDVEAIRSWAGAAEADIDDAQIQLILDAETVVQAAYVSWDPDLYPPGEMPEPLAQALLRRCGRAIAARGVPLSSLPFQDSGVGAPYGMTAPLRMTIPRWDNEVERYEAPWRVAGIA
jgi:hypothetical protein